MSSAVTGSPFSTGRRESARAWLQRELTQLAGAQIGVPAEPLIDPISADGALARVHLRSLLQLHLPAAPLLDAFITTALPHFGDYQDAISAQAPRLFHSLLSFALNVKMLGPAEVIACKHRWDTHSISIQGTVSSWQRLTTRLCLHGPVTPRIPGSLLQTLKTDVFVSEIAAMPIVQTWDLGY